MTTGFIDWTETNITLHLLEKSGGRFNSVDTISIDLEGDPTEETLRSFAETGVENIHLSLPFSLLTVREHRFPFSDTKKINETLPFELDGVLLGSTDDYTIDHIPVSSDDEGSDVLAVCIDKSTLNEIIETFASAGLDPKFVTSIDLRLSGGNIEELLIEQPAAQSLRADAVLEEVITPSINLRQDELAYTGDIEKFKKSFRISAALILVLMIILGVNMFLKYDHAKAENEYLSNELVSIYKRIFPEDKKVIDVKRQIRGKLSTLKKKNTLFASVQVLDILKNIADQNKTEGILLHDFKVEGKSIIVKGTANSFEDVDRFKNSLSPSFRDSKVTDSGATADKKVKFTITMKEKKA